VIVVEYQIRALFERIRGWGWTLDDRLRDGVLFVIGIKDIDMKTMGISIESQQRGGIEQNVPSLTLVRDLNCQV
jgi:hypothetical protein